MIGMHSVGLRAAILAMSMATVESQLGHFERGFCHYGTTTCGESGKSPVEFQFEFLCDRSIKQQAYPYCNGSFETVLEIGGEFISSTCRAIENPSCVDGEYLSTCYLGSSACDTIGTVVLGFENLELSHCQNLVQGSSYPFCMGSFREELSLNVFGDAGNTGPLEIDRCTPAPDPNGCEPPETVAGSCFIGRDNCDFDPSERVLGTPDSTRCHQIATGQADYCVSSFFDGNSCVTTGSTEDTSCFHSTETFFLSGFDPIFIDVHWLTDIRMNAADWAAEAEAYYFNELVPEYPFLLWVHVSIIVVGGQGARNLGRMEGASSHSQHRSLQAVSETWELTFELTFDGPSAGVPSTEQINADLVTALTKGSEFEARLRRVNPTISILKVTKGGTASMEGDPHIKTWGGDWFDYHGECDLVLLHASGFDEDKDLRVHVRTTIRHDYSYIETAAVNLGDDILEVSSWGDYALNGVEGASLEGASIGGYPVYHTQLTKKSHTFDVVVGKAENISIATFKDLVSVRFSGGYHHYGSSSGIMGSFNGTLLARDGTTVMLASDEFGQEWQVSAKEDEPMLFRTVRAPQAPLEKCRLPLPGTKQTRRLGEADIPKEEAEEACAHYNGQRKAACVFDVMTIGDVDIANPAGF